MPRVKRGSKRREKRKKILSLAKAGAFGDLRLSGWARAVVEDVERSLPLGLEHMNLSISTSDQMIRHKFVGRLDRTAVLREMTAATRAAKAASSRAAMSASVLRSRSTPALFSPAMNWL